jgi:hypothetical protein
MRFIISGVLQGFGDLKGQKLVVELERNMPYNAGIAVFVEVQIG